MSDDAQGSLFAASEAVPWTPGWSLVATIEGPHGWHLIDRATPDGGVVTVCGITGRVVRADARMVQPCPICAGSAP